jgi:hypothetical protein
MQIFKIEMIKVAMIRIIFNNKNGPFTSQKRDQKPVQRSVRDEST